jgi:KDO2-lipid IV(A) lauroyltransferase
MRCLLLRPFAWMAALCARLPQRLLLAMAGLLATLLWLPLAKRRRIAATNLALCFPRMEAGERERLLRANLRSMLMGLFELLRAWFAPPGVLRGSYEIEGLPALRDTLAQGQGVLLLLGHFPHTELAVRMLGEALGRRMTGVVRRHNSPCVEAELEHARQRHFQPTLEKKDVRGVLRALRAGEIVAYAADQDFSFRNAFVPFFGVPASTLVGNGKLAARGNARMFALWCRRLPDGRYALRLEPEWPGWREATEIEQAAMYLRALEAEVRKAPEQYLWVHRRFKTRPPGEAPLYA